MDISNNFKNILRRIVPKPHQILLMCNFAPLACPSKALASKIAFVVVVSSDMLTNIVTVPPAPAWSTTVSLNVVVVNPIVVSGYIFTVKSKFWKIKN